MTKASSDGAGNGRGALQRLLSLQAPEESDASFARRLGIAPQVLSNYKNRHHGLSLKSALRVHREAGISLDWLLAGHGAPRPDGDSGEEKPFEAGGRYVFHRLLRSVLSMTEAVEKAGMISGDDGRAIRAPIEEYLKRAGAATGV